MITLPPTATVYTLRGASAPLNYLSNGWLHGVFDKYGGVIPVNYPANLNANSITDGVAEMYRLARSTPGPIIWVMHSQGCQAGSDFIGKYNNDPALPADMTFVMTGNPVRNPTGQLIGAPVVGPMGTKGVATPTNSRWKVIDVARKGDPFAIKTSNPWWNFFADWYGKLFIHPNYKGVDLNDPANVVTQNGNITLVTAP